MPLGSAQIKALEQSARRLTESASISLWMQAILECCSQSTVIEQGSSMNADIFTQSAAVGNINPIDIASPKLEDH